MPTQYETSVPYFDHDCERCRFMGGIIEPEDVEGDAKLARYDLYICFNSTSPTLHSILLRYGNAGAEYLSYQLDSLVQSMPHRSVLRRVWQDFLRGVVVLDRDAVEKAAAAKQA